MSAVLGPITLTHKPDWFETWLGQIEGYDDLHASAAMRRDLCRNLAPDVIGGGATHAPREQERALRIGLNAQRPQLARRGRVAHAALRFPPPGARRDRHPCRLRARRLRRLHRADRRRRHALVPHARGAGGRPRGAHRGVARRGRRQAQSVQRRSATITRCNAASARRAF